MGATDIFPQTTTKAHVDRTNVFLAQNILPQLRLGIQGCRWSRWMSLASRGQAGTSKEGGDRCHQGGVTEGTSASGNAMIQTEKKPLTNTRPSCHFFVYATRSVHVTATRNRIHAPSQRSRPCVNQSEPPASTNNQPEPSASKHRATWCMSLFCWALTDGQVVFHAHEQELFDV